MAEKPIDTPEEIESKLSLGALIGVWLGHLGLWTILIGSVFVLGHESTTLMKSVLFGIGATALTTVQRMLNSLLDQRPFLAGVYATMFGVVGLPMALLLGLVGAGAALALTGLTPQTENIQPASQATSYGINSVDGDESVEQFKSCVAEIYPEAYSQSIRSLQRGGTPKSDAEDFASDAMLKVCKKHVAKGPVDDIPGYFFKAASNQKVSNWRRRQNRDKCAYDLGLDFETGQRSPEDETLFNNLYQEVFCQISTTEKKVLLLHLEGYTGAETGEILGLSRSAAAQHLKRGRTKLKDHFAKVR